MKGPGLKKFLLEYLRGAERDRGATARALDSESYLNRRISQEEETGLLKGPLFCKNILDKIIHVS